MEQHCKAEQQTASAKKRGVGTCPLTGCHPLPCRSLKRREGGKSRWWCSAVKPSPAGMQRFCSPGWPGRAEWTPKSPKVLGFLVGWF